MTDSAAAKEPTTEFGRRRWLMLALGVTAQAVACVFVYGVPYLVPMLRSTEHLSLGQAGTVISAPTIGLVVALVAWGAAADKWGEHIVLGVGLGLSTLVLFAGLAAHGPVLLWLVFFLAGVTGASVYAASGRVVMGWFAAKERGLAMGVRQTSTPLGMCIAALVVPSLAASAGVHGVLLFSAVLTGVVALAVAVWVVDPPRPAKPAAGSAADRPRSPYHSPALWRIHGASALLVWPQFTIGAFGLVYLVDVQHWSAADAGRLMAAGQLIGAGGRIAVGKWSDHVRSRLRPMRQLALANGVLMLLLAACALWHSWAADVVLVLTCGLSASTNGLSFTATAELAGARWAGRALGMQNMGQNVTASLTPPLVGELIGADGYPSSFGVAAALSIAAVLAVPSAARVEARVPGLAPTAARP